MPFASSLRLVLGHPLNRHRVPRALGRVLAWQLRSQLSAGPHIVPWVEGTRLVVRRGDAGLTGNVYCGLHEFAEMGFVLHLVRQDDLFADIGANLGSYTVLACGARLARGFCFEPVPETFSRLLENLRENGLEDRVRVLNCGVGEAEGAVRISLRYGSENHVLAVGEDSPSVEVPVRPLDSLLGGAVPMLAKIDVEGFELPVLRGAAMTLADPGLKAVIMEVNGNGAKYGFSDQDLREAMERKGFREHTYDPFTRTLAALDRHGTPLGNGIFVRDVDFVVSRLRAAPPFAVNGLSI